MKKRITKEQALEVYNDPKTKLLFDIYFLSFEDYWRECEIINQMTEEEYQNNKKAMSKKLEQIRKFFRRKMKNKFLELQKLAEDWKQFSNENYGWKTKEYLKDGMRVWCYFDDTGRASAVQFGNIQVSFFKQVEFDSITLDDLDRLDEIIEKYRRFLDEVKAKKERRQNENKQNI